MKYFGYQKYMILLSVWKYRNLHVYNMNWMWWLLSLCC